MQEALSDIRVAGANLVAVSPQREEFLRQMRQKHTLEFDILRDAGNELAEEFGLRFVLPDYLQTLYAGFGIDLPRVNGDESWTLPMSARYIIGQDGIIVVADFDPDYTRRPDPTNTVEALKKLKSS